MEKVSFVIPCYRSEKTIEIVVKEIKELFSGQTEYDYEIVLVNDYSPDNVWSVIKKLTEDTKIKGVCLAKNFGQASAVMAGYGQVTGDYIVTVDDDGQSPLDSMMQALELLKEKDYDVVYGTCEEAKFNLFRRMGSKLNSWMAKVMFDRPSSERVVSLSVARRFVIEEMLRYQNAYPYISGLVYRTTRNIGYLPVQHRKRMMGTSGYSFGKLVKVWLNGFTAFSIKPLRMASILGFVSSFLGLLCAVITIINKLIHPNVAIGWSSTISVTLILGGIILLVLGMIGEYLGRIYMCINQTPQYVVRETINIDEKN